MYSNKAYREGVSDTRCSGLAFATQFFLLAAELWLGALAWDLIAAQRRPFLKPTTLHRVFIVVVNTLALGTAVAVVVRLHHSSDKRMCTRRVCVCVCVSLEASVAFVDDGVVVPAVYGKAIFNTCWIPPHRHNPLTYNTALWLLFYAWCMGIYLSAIVIFVITLLRFKILRERYPKWTAVMTRCMVYISA